VNGADGLRDIYLWGVYVSGSGAFFICFMKAVE